MSMCLGPGCPTCAAKRVSQPIEKVVPIRTSIFNVARNPSKYGGSAMFPVEVETAIRKMRLEYRDRTRLRI